MQIFQGSVAHLPEVEASAVSLGVFDGLHQGHQAILKRLVDESRARGLPSLVITFDPHPVQWLQPQTPVRALFPRSDLVRGCRQLGIDYLFILEFGAVLAQLSAPDFFRNLILARLHPRLVIVGHGFAFGRNRGGDGEFLQRHFHREFETIVHKPVLFNERRVSSTWIRQLLAQGDVAMVKELLQRPFYLSGKVLPGEGRGKVLGFPTLNLVGLSGEQNLSATRHENIEGEVFSDAVAQCVPLSGVYFTRVKAGMETFDSITNVGIHPTFAFQGVKIESHILHAPRDSFGSFIEVHFYQRLREEIKFPSKSELIAQIQRDVNEAVSYWVEHGDLE